MTKIKNFNWGILGCGHIASQFATSLSLIPNVTLKAVASRSRERASEFAQKFNAEKFSIAGANRWIKDFQKYCVENRLYQPENSSLSRI